MPTRHLQGCVDVITLDERLTADEVDQVVAYCREVLCSGIPQVVIDLRHVRVVDSAGLEALCDFNDECQRLGGDLRLSSGNRLIRDVLHISGVDAIISISDDTIQAAGEFAL